MAIKFLESLKPLKALAVFFKRDFSVIFQVSIFVVLISIIQLGLSNDRIFVHDLSSYLAPVQAWLQNDALPYKDFFDIKPPGIYFILYSFGYFLSLSHFYLVTFYFVILLLFNILYLQVSIKVSSRNYLFLIFLQLTLLTFVSNSFSGMFLPTEIIGCTLLLAALSTRLRSTFHTKRYTFVYVLLLSASLIRENYIFVFFILVTFDLMVQNKKSSVLKSAFLAISLTYGATFCILLKLDLLASYVEVLQFKGRVFGVTINSIILFVLSSPYTLVFNLLSLLAFILFVFKFYRVQQGRYSKNSVHVGAILFVFFISAWIGLLAQGKSLSGHYLLSSWPFLSILCLFMLAELKSKSSHLFIILILIFLFAPLNQIFSSKPFEHLGNPFNSTMKAFSGEDNLLREQFLVQEKDCFQVAYGWATGSYYFYSKSLPCNRFYLPSLISVDEKAVNLYRDELLKSPPAFILFNPKAHDGNLDLFNQNVFNFPRVLANCYTNTGGNRLYSLKGVPTSDSIDCLTIYS